MHIARVGERLLRLQIQFRISRSFRPRNLANLGSKTRFWIRRKEHTPQTPFRGETSGGVAKCRLFPQASFARFCLLNQLRSKEPANKLARFSYCCCCCLFQAVFETTLTRVLLPLPVLVIPPFVMQLLER